MTMMSIQGAVEDFYNQKIIDYAMNELSRNYHNGIYYSLEIVNRLLETANLNSVEHFNKVVEENQLKNYFEADILKRVIDISEVKINDEGDKIYKWKMVSHLL